jgi:hypothetical protein
MEGTRETGPRIAKGQDPEYPWGIKEVNLSVKGERWQVHLSDVWALNPHWFVRFIATGPQTCTIFVGTDRAPNTNEECRRLIAYVLDWLVRSDRRSFVFLDLTAKREPAGSSFEATNLGDLAG